MDRSTVNSTKEIKQLNTFKIKTFGCKVNQSESEDISESIIASGLVMTDDADSADVVIINTCAVTQKASMQSRQAIRRTIRRNSNAKLIVTGCYVHISPEEISKMGKVDFITTNECKHKIAKDFISTRAKSIIPRLEFVPKNNNLLKDIYQNNIDKKTRPFVKIQNGCNSFCTYCIVPYTRGRSKSLSEDKIIKKINALQTKGYKEIVLTGVHIGTWGKDLSPKTKLYELLNKVIINECIERIRISSIEPRELSDEIIQLTHRNAMGKSRICQHFHIPLQSGDNFILNKMRRPYNNKYFIKLIKKILRNVPTCAIGTDILVGFPGETERSFNNTYNLINNNPISYLHVFPFSPRKGTPAWNYPNKIDPKDIKERCRKIRKLGMQKQQSFYRKFLGETVPVLVENTRDKSSGKLKGFSENYIPVQFDGTDSLCNTIQKIKIDKITKNNYAEGSLQSTII